MCEKRIGRQTPTVSRVLPYKETFGLQATLLYDQSRRKSMEWQELMMCDIMAVDENGLWTHMKFGWSIPRRNGKSELLIMRADWGLTHSERVLYTAHLTSTSSDAWGKCIRLLTSMGFVENDDFKTTRVHGQEHIEWLKGDEPRGVINFRTRTATGGLGEGYDVLIIDEAQEYTADQESALKYVVTDSKNPQTLMCGTPPTAVSGGTVFAKYRSDTLSGAEDSENCGWAEWSVPKLSNTRDVDLWYETNPSLGTILTERTVRSELGSDPMSIDDNIQRLGVWITYSQKSAISEAEWNAHKLTGKPPVSGKPQIFLGVKFAKDTGNVTLAAAVRLESGGIFVEDIDCRDARDGTDWLIPFMKNPHVGGIIIDGANGQQALADDMKRAGIKIKPVLPTVKEVIAANDLFEKRLFGGEIFHAGQPALAQAVSNCEHRAIGNGGGYGWKSILEGADISLLEAVSLAHSLCAAQKKRKPQKVSY
ncbi:MAG: terminase [Clostridia bacterium]|nr:terminase [Clostridia bacterium]